MDRRFEETNRRIDAIATSLTDLRAELKGIKERDEIIKNMLRRIQRLEEKVLA